jgi:hypothetical protein
MTNNSFGRVIFFFLGHNGKLKGCEKMSGWILAILIILAFIVFMFILILITKLPITLSLYHGNDNDHFKVKLRAWFGLLRYTIDVPMVKLDDDGPNIVVEEKNIRGKENEPSSEKESKKKFTPSDFINSLNDTKEILIHVKEMHKIIKRFLRKVKIDQVLWKTLFGTGDAAATGTMTGAIWALKGSIIGLISGYMRLQTQPSIEVIPSFQKAVIQTHFSCIIQFRIGNAILVGFKILRYWRGGRAQFKTKMLSRLSEEKQQSV